MKETTNQEMYRAIWLSVGVTLLGFLGGLAADFLWEMYQKANPDLAFKFGITAVIGFFGLCGFLLIFSFFKEFQASLEKPQKSNNRSSGESEATSDVDPNQKKEKFQIPQVSKRPRAGNRHLFRIYGCRCLSLQH
ncbi:hypothetical protein [Geoglobus ahangari]|uniref:hypothetical protein n=1 Tax=Geoglobus ahangari TaxID=113653 RepID=UPI00064E95F0|nr:hypothetical protein [Geoglobus ahangari]